MATLPDRDPREIRASDQDRDRVAEVLRAAAGEGRLAMEEFNERLDQAYSAKTYAELELVTRDLPELSEMPAQAPVPASAPTGPVTGGVSIGIMGGFKRAGVWRAPRKLTALAFWGGGRIDLREAVLTGPDITIWAFAIMGGIEVFVPEDAEVVVNGVGIMGGFPHDASGGSGRPGAQRVIVNGFAFWGGVETKRKSRKKKRKPEDD